MAKAATVDDVAESLFDAATEDSVLADEDWTAERDTLVETERNLDLIIAQKVAEQVAAIFAKQAADAVGPPKTMRSTVYDKFVANTNNDQSRGGEVLRHY